MDKKERIIKSACQACHCECGVLVHVRNGKVMKIEGDSDHPMNEGRLCPKGLAYTQLMYHPDRLKYPLKRVGERGEGKWQRISWDKALGIISQKFKEIIEKYGPLSIGFVNNDGPRTYLRPYLFLLFALGSPNNFGVQHVCYFPSLQADIATYGDFITQEVGPDFDNSKCMLIWGANPVHTHPMIAMKILRAKWNGAKLIVVDPRFTALASKADIWLQVRPSSDCALALGMLNVIVNNELYDGEFVEEWCIGFEELRKRVQEYTPERVEEITWVPKEQIEKAAKTYAKVKPASHYHRVALNQSTNSYHACRALAILVAITGNLDVKGGNLFDSKPEWYKSAIERSIEACKSLPKALRKRQIGAKEFPLLAGPEPEKYSWGHGPLAIKAILTGKPYPLKAVFGVSNFITAFENSKEVIKALKKLEFLVLSDFFMNPTLEYADIILPAATWVEVDDICGQSYLNYLSVRQKATEPLYECKDERWIAIEIAKRMGVLKRFLPQEETVEKYLNWWLKPITTFDELRKKVYVINPLTKYKRYEERVKTPSGKVELYSSISERLGLDALPNYEEPYESYLRAPELQKDYPLILTNRRHIAFYHAANRQIPWLRELNPEPTIEIHPKTAEELSIKEGDWVWIETPKGRGRVKQKATLTLGIHPRVVCAEPFWWFPERGGPEYGCLESNINVLTSNDPPYDPNIGSTLLRGGLCRVYKEG